MGLFSRKNHVRVTKQDHADAMDVMAEMQAKAAEQQRLQRDGIAGTAEIVAINQDVRVVNGMPRHEVIMDVTLPNYDTYRATREVALALDSAPWFTTGVTVTVAADREDRGTVVITQNL